MPSNSWRSSVAEVTHRIVMNGNEHHFHLIYENHNNNFLWCSARICTEHSCFEYLQTIVGVPRKNYFIHRHHCIVDTTFQLVYEWRKLGDRFMPKCVQKVKISRNSLHMKIHIMKFVAGKVNFTYFKSHHNFFWEMCHVKLFEGWEEQSHISILNSNHFCG